MGGLFDKPKEIKPPPVKPTPPPPRVDADEVGTQARKTRPRGFRETFLTGDLVPEFTGKKQRLA